MQIAVRLSLRHNMWSQWQG